MFNTQSLRNVVLFVLASVVCIGPSAYAAGSSEELFNLIPAESMLAVRVNNFDLAIGQLDTYLAGLSPIPVSLSMLAKMQLAQMLGSQTLSGIDTAGNFGAYALAKPGQIKPVVNVLVPVTNYAEFVSGNPNVGEADENGISQVTMNGRTLAAVKKAGNYAIFAEDKESINLNTGKGLETAIDAAEKNIAETKPIWAYVNVQKAGEVYGEMAVAQLEKGKTMMADATTCMEAELAKLEKRKAKLDVNDPNQIDKIEKLDKRITSTKDAIKQFDNNPMKDSFASIMDMYIRIAETLLKESKSFSLAIEPTGDVLTILETYTAMDGSDSAKALVADTSGNKADKLINYLQDGAMTNFVCRLNKPLLQKFYSDWICLMGVMTDGKMSDEEVTKLKEITVDIIDSLGGAMAVSMWADETASPPFMEDCIIEVSDTEKFNNTLLKAIELWNDSALMDFYKDMGMNMTYVTKMNLYEYKGAEVNSAKLTFESADPNSQQAQIIEKMYGGGFEYRWAVVDGLCVEAIAGDVEEAVKQLIDEVKAGGSTEPASEVMQAITMLGDGADDFFGTFNVVRLLKMISAMPESPIKNVSVESTSNIAFGGKVGNGKVTIKIAVPKAHITEIMTAVMPKPAAK